MPPILNWSRRYAKVRVMRNRICEALLLVFLFHFALVTAPGHASPERRLSIENGHFVLDGKPLQVISGEMHYSRIPREYWRIRLKMAKAMGLNTVSTYVFWNMHEPRPGVFDFTGQQDIAAFIRLAKEEGLYVILRPGPYSCAEWDLGGFPAWLLADPDVVLRSTDDKFMKPAERWIARLGQEVSGLQLGNGGPIVAVQVENEYGSFDRDKGYLHRIYAALRNAGFAKSLLYTADGPKQLPEGTLPELPAVVNLGPGDAKTGLEILAKFRPGQPLMIGEWWAGWFDHWGRPHHETNGDDEAKELDWVLANGYSINLYMFHGGTTRGFMNGANSDFGGYWPDVSSYDYSAALDESGRPTKKYFQFRDVIARHTSESLPEAPKVEATIETPEIKLDRTASLFANLPQPVKSDAPVNMEALGQAYGYILYRTQITGPMKGDLVIQDVRDYAQVYAGGKLAGILDRRLNQDRLPIDVKDSKTQLDILIENTGRINFTKALRNERKGITKSVMLGGKVLTGWQIYCLPMNDLAARRYESQPATGPAFYRGIFRIDETGDTFLDLGKWSKGTVWVNRHQLGRFWKIGPQQTLYLPGPWLKRGENEIVVFDLEPQASPTVRGVRRPVLDDLREPHPSLRNR
jgi:beta-galactosidase